MQWTEVFFSRFIDYYFRTERSEVIPGLCSGFDNYSGCLQSEIPGRAAAAARRPSTEKSSRSSSGNAYGSRHTAARFKAMTRKSAKSVLGRQKKYRRKAFFSSAEAGSSTAAISGNKWTAIPHTSASPAQLKRNHP